MILVITIIMITVQSTPTIAPIMASSLLQSQDSQVELSLTVTVTVASS